jgi:proteasome alpha subunit
MTSPLYVSPEQWFQDKAEYARKGIARGRPIVAIEYGGGVVMMAENRSATLRKISEIYDTIAFGGVGKLDEYETLRKSGVRYADLRGYSFSREDVSGKGLANEYSTLLGSVFTREMKPFEVEILVVDASSTSQTFYRVLYDGSMTDHDHFASIGGDFEKLSGILRNGWKEGLSLNEAISLGRKALSGDGSGNGSSSPDLDETSLEVAVLDRAREGRKFRRLPKEEIRRLICR